MLFLAPGADPLRAAHDFIYFFIGRAFCNKMSEL